MHCTIDECRHGSSPLLCRSKMPIVVERCLGLSKKLHGYGPSREIEVAKLLLMRNLCMMLIQHWTICILKHCHLLVGALPAWSMYELVTPRSRFSMLWHGSHWTSSWQPDLTCPAMLWILTSNVLSLRTCTF